MATQPITDVVVGGQDLGTGLGDNADPGSAGTMALFGARSGMQAFVVANYAEGLDFVDRDPTNDTITVGTGLCYIVDDATISPTADDGNTYRDGNVTVQSQKTGVKPWSYDHELAGDIVYPVEVRTQTTVDVAASTANSIWINITDLTANNGVEIRSDGGGGTTAEPSGTYLLLGTADPDGSASGDTRPNDFEDPIFRALEVRGDITDDQSNTIYDYSEQAVTPPRVDTPTIENDDYHETVTTGTVSGTVGLDLSASNFFRHTLSGDTTFAFNNPSGTPPGNSFTLIVEQDGTGGHAITWPSSVEWDGGTAPSLSTAANDKHMLGFISPDGGTTWIGVVSGTQIA